MKHTRLIVLVLALLTVSPGLEGWAGPPQQTHDLGLAPRTVHWGYYDGGLSPVLTIASGDIVRLETLIARGLDRLLLAGAPEDEIPDRLKVVEREVTDRGVGAHPMTGPIYVEDAEPGDVVEIRIQGFEFLHPFGVSYFPPGSGTLPDDFPYTRLRLTRFDPQTGKVDFAPGITLELAPFFGSIGVGPAPILGRINTNPPGHHVGNLDNKDLVAGSSLFIPVHVPGALISFGDGHALQGDGEVALTALETSLRGTVQILLHKDRTLTRPRAETPTHFITMGLHPDLDEAARMATREMIDFLVNEKGLERGDAYILCSLAMDLAVTQLVDGTKGVHGKISKSIFDSSP